MALSHAAVLTLAGAALALCGTLANAQTGATGAASSDTTLGGASQASHATTVPSVTVRANRMVRHQIVGSDYAGIPIEQLSLSRQIGYQDINIHSAKGVARLRHRIDRTARSACRELSTLYPNNVWTTSEGACVTNAVQSALQQLPSSVAAAVGPASSFR